MWDMGHYQTVSKERKYSLNQDELKEYFPLSVVTAGLLQIYQTILGLRFTSLPDAEKWNEDVEVVSILHWKVEWKTC
jgi:Zn-dependent oligopeptidase